jgi:hypothetical protein
MLAPWRGGMTRSITVMTICFSNSEKFVMLLWNGWVGVHD